VLFERTCINLACSANLPIGLYILPALILFFNTSFETNYLRIYLTDYPYVHTVAIFSFDVFTASGRVL